MRREDQLYETVLAGEAAIHKRLLDRDRLKDPSNGVKYFKSFLRPLFGRPVCFSTASSSS